MENISQLIPPLPNIQVTALSYEDLLRAKSEYYNSLSGSLTGFDCDKCFNKGIISEIKNGTEVFHTCECQKIRDTLKKLMDSGLSNLVNNCRFKTYVASEPWQSKIKEQAMKYAVNPDGWFVMLGQTGAGKTHLCTSIVRELMYRGNTAKYFMWEKESKRLKSMLNTPEYEKEITSINLTDVLYIDDLFKGGASTADVKLAYEIINGRVIDDKITVISSELYEDDLIQIDEALAGRIILAAKKNTIRINKDIKKNYRLK